MRDIKDETGKVWRVLAVESAAAHLRSGATLGFVAADEEGAEPLLTGVSFNSPEAAEFAIRTMADKELLRRLNWARQEAGRV
ncbi:MAG: hypothetical protein M3P24_08470 [Gemmatimonadota bacterium]|nr:hypothetical protein [Gemmatimonadota bacterium]